MATKIITHGNQTHGMTSSPEHISWKGMKQRCLNKNNPAYNRYGGRGIKICNEWMHSFDSFYHDMGPKTKNKSLDRIDNDGNYESGNCRWATSSEQARNRRSQRRSLSGVNGIYLITGNKWRVGIFVNNKMLHIGCFEDRFDAICARKSAENKYWS